jgi:hypothetical protein
VAEYKVLKGIVYLGTTVLFIAGVTQTIFRDAAFVGQEGALIV